MSSIYDRALLGIDRVSSVVFVCIYDLFSRPKPGQVEVMLCRFKYSDDASSQESIEKITLEDTLNGYFENPEKVSIHHWDVDQPSLFFGAHFYKKVATLNPKKVIISSYSPGLYYQPMPWIFSRLRKRNIQVVSLWWDTCWDGFAKSIAPVIDAIEVHGIIENPTLNFGNSQDSQRLKQKAVGLYSPYNFSIEKSARDIDVAFMGQVSSYRNSRRAYLDHLIESSVNVYYSAFGKDQQCSQEKYFEVLSRAKIGINFSQSVDKHQLKARVFEVMHSGCLLLEERNEQTALYFEEDKDYVAFSSKEELLEKIRYYLAHEAERKAISESGNRKVKQLYNGSIFWEKLIGHSSDVLRRNEI